MENEVIISLCGVSCRRDGKDVLHDVNLDIRQGDFVAITGPNGGGKTTLLRIVLKLLKPSHGSVKYLSTGEEVKELSIGYLPQKNMIDSRFPIT
ncbi:MAG: ATP-binding cassette domain-containing protein, partial [Duncaniella sp.]|nr:ATP-binding cassette domain-containing protein [Duncaniella sp.]